MKFAMRLIAQHLLRLPRQKSGAAAIEFALIAIPMMIIIAGSIQNIVLSTAKLSLDFTLQNLAYEAANSDATLTASLFTRSSFCGRVGFYLADCNSDTQFCFNVISLDHGGTLQAPVLDCNLKAVQPSSQNCCYQIIASYPIPTVFNISTLFAPFLGATPQQKYLYSIAFIYRI